MLLETRERHDLEGARIGRREYDGRGEAVLVGLQPTGGDHAPTVARGQAEEAVLRPRRREVVADRALVAQEVLGHHGADRVQPHVLGTARAEAVAVEPGQGFGAARLELAAEDVALRHGSGRLSPRATRARADPWSSRPRRPVPGEPGGRRTAS